MEGGPKIDLSESLQQVRKGSLKGKKMEQVAASLAADLTKAQVKLLSQVTPQELAIDFTKDKNIPGKENYAINKLADLSTKITYSIMTDILLCDSKKEIIKVYEFYAHVAEQCLKNGDYQSAMAIDSAFQNPELQRLKIMHQNDARQTVFDADVPRTLKKKFHNLSSIVSPDINYKNYKSQENIVVPLMAVITKESAFLREAMSALTADDDKALKLSPEELQALPEETKQKTIARVEVLNVAIGENTEKAKKVTNIEAFVGKAKAENAKPFSPQTNLTVKLDQPTLKEDFNYRNGGDTPKKDSLDGRSRAIKPAGGSLQFNEPASEVRSRLKASAVDPAVTPPVVQPAPQQQYGAMDMEPVTGPYINMEPVVNSNNSPAQPVVGAKSAPVVPAGVNIGMVEITPNTPEQIGDVAVSQPTVVAQLMSGRRDPADIETGLDAHYSEQNYHDIATGIFVQIDPAEFYEQLSSAFQNPEFNDNDRRKFLKNAEIFIKQAVKADVNAEFGFDMSAGLTRFCSQAIKEQPALKQEIDEMGKSISDDLVKAQEAKQKRAAQPEPKEPQKPKNIAAAKASDLRQYHLGLIQQITLSSVTKKGLENFNEQNNPIRLLENSGEKLTQVVEIDVLGKGTKSQKQKEYARYVNIMHECIEQGDFHAARAIGAGIKRLDPLKLYENLSKSDRAKYENAEIFNGIPSAKVTRQAVNAKAKEIEQKGGVCIPYIGTFKEQLLQTHGISDKSSITNKFNEFKTQTMGRNIQSVLTVQAASNSAPPQNYQTGIVSKMQRLPLFKEGGDNWYTNTIDAAKERNNASGLKAVFTKKDKTNLLDELNKANKWDKIDWSDTVQIKAMQEFAKTIYADENLEFIVEVESLKYDIERANTPAKVAELATKITKIEEKFYNENSTNAINIAGGNRVNMSAEELADPKKLQQRIDRLYEAQQELMLLTESDIFPKFVKSEQNNRSRFVAQDKDLEPIKFRKLPRVKDELLQQVPPPVQSQYGNMEMEAVDMNRKPDFEAMFDRLQHLIDDTKEPTGDDIDEISRLYDEVKQRVDSKDIGGGSIEEHGFNELTGKVKALREIRSAMVLPKPVTPQSEVKSNVEPVVSEKAQFAVAPEAPEIPPKPKVKVRRKRRLTPEEAQARRERRKQEEAKSAEVQPSVAEPALAQPSTFSQKIQKVGEALSKVEALMDRNALKDPQFDQKYTEAKKELSAALQELEADKTGRDPSEMIKNARAMIDKFDKQIEEIKKPKNEEKTAATESMLESTFEELKSTSQLDQPPPADSVPKFNAKAYKNAIKAGLAPGAIFSETRPRVKVYPDGKASLAFLKENSPKAEAFRLALLDMAAKDVPKKIGNGINKKGDLVEIVYVDASWLRSVLEQPEASKTLRENYVKHMKEMGAENLVSPRILAQSPRAVQTAAPKPLTSSPNAKPATVSLPEGGKIQVSPSVALNLVKKPTVGDKPVTIKEVKPQVKRPSIVPPLKEPIIPTGSMKSKAAAQNSGPRMRTFAELSQQLASRQSELNNLNPDPLASTKAPTIKTEGSKTKAPAQGPLTFSFAAKQQKGQPAPIVAPPGNVINAAPNQAQPQKLKDLWQAKINKDDAQKQEEVGRKGPRPGGGGNKVE